MDTSATPEYKFHPLRRKFHYIFVELYIPLSFHDIKNSEISYVNAIEVFEIPPDSKGGLHSATYDKYVI